MTTRRLLLQLLGVGPALLPRLARAGQPVRIATLKTGTVAWEIDTIIHQP